MRALMRSLAPTSFDDVAALVALYRPGPMSANMHNDNADRKNGRKPISYIHPDAEALLGDTYGLMIYQESVMRVAQKFAGYSLAEADNLRKACLPAGTRVLTRTRGYVPIELVMKLADKSVQVIDERSATTRFDRVDDVWSVGVKPVFRLTTSTGYAIEATDNHRFLVDDEWRELRDIRPGDLVGVASHTHTEGGSKATMAEVELAALVVSEGYTPDPDGPNRTGHFCNTDPELLETFRRAFAGFFGYEHDRASTIKGVTTLRFSKAEMRALLPLIGSYGLAADKQIVDRFVNAPMLKAARFLGLYFCADGWADNSGAHFGSKSYAVVRTLKRMLLRFGIISNLHSRVVRNHGRHWTLSIADKGQAKAFALLVQPHLTTVKAAKVDRWLGEWSDGASATNIGIPAVFLADELKRRAALTGKSKRQLGVNSGGYTKGNVLHRDTLNGLLYSERLEDLRTGDLVWDTVVSVEYSRDAECFDFQMADGERPYAVVEDFLVHNCGKKVREIMAQERQKFVDGCVTTGYGDKLGTQLFDIIEPFADYAFNKSHSYGYGYIAYQTAYLKAHYPVEYLACLLTSVKANLDKAAVYLAECRNMNVKVLTPDVNLSQSDFAALAPHEAPDPSIVPVGSPGLIPFGLSAVRNVGEALVALIVAEREKNGAFTDFYDFVERVDPGVLNKRTVESLVKAGAFDSMGHKRRALLTVFEQIIDTTLVRRRERDQGVISLFEALAEDQGNSFTERIPIPELEFDKAQRLRFEKEMLGLYVSDHPLLGAEAALRRKCDGTISEVIERGDQSMVALGGVVTALSRKFTKKGDPMAVFTLEDLQSSIEVTVFSRTILEHGHKLNDDAVVIVRGRLEARDETPKLLCQDIEVFDGITDGASPLRLKLPASMLSEEKIGKLKALLLEFPGDSPVFVHLGRGKVLRLSDEFCVDLGRVVGEVRVAFGHDAVIL
jgi:DNA polymerase-3 subunit alpha